MAFEKQKPKIGRAIKNNYSTAENYRKPRYYWHKSRYYIEHPETSCKLSKFLRQAKRVSQVSGAVKKSTSPLYTEKTILETLFDETKTISNAEITRDVMLIKVKQVLIMLKFWILLILNYTQEENYGIRRKLLIGKAG